jgi:nicotinamidase-related amidase
MAGLIDVDDSILVVVDTQPGFLDKLESETAHALEDRVRWLARVAMYLGVPTVVTEEESDRNGATSEAVRSILPEGQVRHRKEAFGLTACPEIVADLVRHRRATAVLCGLETDVCVAQSAIGLLDDGWRVAVVSDAVGAPGPAHELGLARMRDAGVVLVGTKGLLYEWLRTVERAWQLDRALGGDTPMGIMF